jgi:hypothetical protein
MGKSTSFGGSVDLRLPPRFQKGIKSEWLERERSSALELTNNRGERVEAAAFPLERWEPFF